MVERRVELKIWDEVSVSLTSHPLSEEQVGKITKILQSWAVKWEADSDPNPKTKSLGWLKWSCPSGFDDDRRMRVQAELLDAVPGVSLRWSGRLVVTTVSQQIQLWSADPVSRSLY